ncbi:hypothetical protein MITS9509_02740 [Synechococcus sp. MIT S9509]|uniref:hypothetical protein n=1 Tax=unclassified Synechococcus TaxID=2626047 RepID=UPI0007BAE342|nr:MULTISPECIES: hypothetical protein [unclassified Synechococcus]KZR85557.1 hypothetical protein MITS9504_02094 [Synechococcus sp. MIT S9504]KZR90451.1 hypothetical protein MITS9509_02740 [Synechococcus sp. MIT S9509]
MRRLDQCCPACGVCRYAVTWLGWCRYMLQPLCTALLAIAVGLTAALMVFDPIHAG